MSNLIRNQEWYKKLFPNQVRSVMAHDDKTDNFTALLCFILTRFCKKEGGSTKYSQELLQAFSVITPEDFFELMDANSDDTDLDVSVAFFIRANAPTIKIYDMAESFIASMPVSKEC